MHILHNFFKIVRDRLENFDSEDICTDIELADTSYPFLYDMDPYITHEYGCLIGDRILSLKPEDKEIYAKCILEEFHNLFSITFANTKKIEERKTKLSTNHKENGLQTCKEEENQEYLETYYFKTRLGEIGSINCYALVTDCYYLLFILQKHFAKSEINLKSIAQEQGLELDYIDKLEEIKFSGKEKYASNRTYTLARQVLGIETLLSELGVKINDNKTAIAKFVQFLTGRQVDSLPQNTNAYKHIGNNRKTTKNYNKDCDFVAKQFEDISLCNLAKKINLGKESEN